MKRLMVLLVSALLILAMFTGCTRSGSGNVSTGNDGTVNGTNTTESTGGILNTVVDDLSEMGEEIMTDATEGNSHRSGSSSGSGRSGGSSTGSGSSSNGSGSGSTGSGRSGSGSGRSGGSTGSGSGSGMGA